MQNIGWTKSPDRTTSTPEIIGETIEEMARDLRTIWLLVPMVCLDLLSEHRHLYGQDIFRYRVGKYT